MKHYPFPLKRDANLKCEYADHQGVRLAGAMDLWMGCAD